MDSDGDILALHKLQNGDEAGLVALMAAHKEAVFHFVLRYTSNEADAREITEETFVRVFFNANRFVPRTAKVRSWIFTIAGNLCRDHFRRNKKRKSTFSLDASLNKETETSLEDTIADPSRNASEDAESNEKVREVEAAIQNLPHKLKVPFIFCVLEENSYNECSQMLNVSVKTVETRIYRARLLLREALSG